MLTMGNTQGGWGTLTAGNTKDGQCSWWAREAIDSSAGGQ